MIEAGRLVALRPAGHYHFRNPSRSPNAIGTWPFAVDGSHPTRRMMTPLKLIALDAEDLAVVSAHAQDAVVRVADMAYLPREHRFVALINRFDWTSAAAGGAADRSTFARCRSALRFDRVLAAQVQGIDLGQRSSVLNLLAMSFEPTTAPEGHVVLLFAGGAAIRLHVECIEGEIRDLGAVWGTKRRPEHPDEASGS